MDRNECSFCGGYFHPEHEHSCIFRENSDDAFFTSFIDELEDIDESLEGWRNIPIDGVSDSSAKEDDTELSCLLEEDKKNSFSNPDQNSLPSPTPIPTGFPLYVSTYHLFHDLQPTVSDASVENPSAVRVETSGAVNGIADDNHSGHFSSLIADCSTGSSEEHFSVAGPSGIQTQPLITQEGKRFLCNLCGGSFSQKNGLVTHYKRHSGEKPFTCETCGHRCLLKNDLTKHRRKHTGEKPYVCIVCNRGFSQTSQLRPHLQTHTGEKPFECSECGKKFARKDSLKGHLKTHSRKEKPHNCKICENTYGSQAACNHRHDRKDEGK